MLLLNTILEMIESLGSTILLGGEVVHILDFVANTLQPRGGSGSAVLEQPAPPAATGGKNPILEIGQPSASGPNPRSMGLNDLRIVEIDDTEGASVEEDEEMEEDEGMDRDSDDESEPDENDDDTGDKIEEDVELALTSQNMVFTALNLLLAILEGSLLSCLPLS